MQTVDQYTAEELERGLLQGGRDLEYLLFIDDERRQADWAMRLENLTTVIERARDAHLSNEDIRAAVAMGLFPELFS